MLKIHTDTKPHQTLRGPGVMQTAIPESVKNTVPFLCRHPPACLCIPTHCPLCLHPGSRIQMPPASPGPTPAPACATEFRCGPNGTICLTFNHRPSLLAKQRLLKFCFSNMQYDKMEMEGSSSGPWNGTGEQSSICGPPPNPSLGSLCALTKPGYKLEG